MKVVTRLFVSFVVTCVLGSLFTPASAAIVPPRFVYRADFRAPDNIFLYGLQRIGDNINMLDHVQGGSCSYGPNPSTAFVATTSEEAFAESWGGDQLWIDRFKAGPIVQIYKIRATPDFYDCYESLLLSSTNARDKRSREQYKAAAAKYQYQKEWLAHTGISPELIVSAKIFDKDIANPGKLRLLRTEQNPRYIQMASQGNPAPFRDQGSHSTGAISFLASRLPSLSSCFGSCSPLRPRRSGYASSRRGSSCPTKKIVFEPFSGTEKATVWDPVDNNRRERIVPWEEEMIIKGHVIEKPKDCRVDTGHGNDIAPPIIVHCPRNGFYDSFVVLLRAGIGEKTMLHSKHKDGVTGKNWKKKDNEIPTLEYGQTLADKYWMIHEVFTDMFDSRWWSEIRVLPVYPNYVDPGN